MNVRHFALGVAVCVVSVNATFSADGERSVKVLFGGSVIESPYQKAPLAADLDGDGRPDDIYLLNLLAQGADDRAGKDVAFSNPWSNKPRNPRGGSVAIGVRLASGARYVFYDDDFFSSPIWQQKALPVTVVKRGTKEHREFARQAGALRHDIIVLGTEAGIDIALYWDGRRFMLLQPKEVP